VLAAQAPLAFGFDLLRIVFGIGDLKENAMGAPVIMAFGVSGTGLPFRDRTRPEGFNPKRSKRYNPIAFNGM
jgi:hypothetical protein